MIAKLTNLFWLWTILGVSYAWLLPSHFTWFVPYITPALAIIMLGMGMTLRTSDFLTVLKRPIGIAIGVGAQFIIMPSLGYCIAKAFNLEPGLAAGLILVSCCPGGTASNVIVFLARGNVSLSVLMTMTSTLLAVILTPYLTGWLAGSYVPIDEVALLKKTLTVVLLPVLLGLALNHWGTRYIKPISTYSPWSRSSPLSSSLDVSSRSRRMPSFLLDGPSSLQSFSSTLSPSSSDTSSLNALDVMKMTDVP